MLSVLVSQCPRSVCCAALTKGLDWPLHVATTPGRVQRVDLMSEEDEGRRLRNGRVVNTMSASEGKQIEKYVEELHARVHELEQKLAMSEQAVDDKDER